MSFTSLLDSPWPHCGIVAYTCFHNPMNLIWMFQILTLMIQGNKVRFNLKYCRKFFAQFFLVKQIKHRNKMGICSYTHHFFQDIIWDISGHVVDTSCWRVGKNDWSSGYSTQHTKFLLNDSINQKKNVLWEHCITNQSTLVIVVVCHYMPCRY